MRLTDTSHVNGTIDYFLFGILYACEYRDFVFSAVDAGIKFHSCNIFQ